MEEIKNTAAKLVASSQKDIILRVYSGLVKNHNPINDCNCDYCTARDVYVTQKRYFKRFESEIYSGWPVNLSVIGESERIKRRVEELRTYKNSLKIV